MPNRAAPPPITAPAAKSPLPFRSAPPVRTSGLAVASLVCSCVGLLAGFFGTIPGIICGHKALSRISRNPGLGGKGLATAGLITGYALTLLWLPLTYILVVATISGFRAAARLAANPPGMRNVIVRDGNRPSTFGNPARITTLNSDTATDLKPDTAGWMPDLENAEIPESTASGRVQGLPFKAEQVALDVFGLEFAQGMSPGAPPEAFRNLSLRFDKRDVQSYAGRTFTVSSTQRGEGVPSVRMCWIDPQNKQPRDSMLNDYQYALRLEFGALQGTQLPGRIYLCVLDKNKSFLRGKFMAQVDANLLASAGSSAAAASSSAPAFFRPQDDVPPDTAADDAGWTLDLADAVIPDALASGRLHGAAFKLERVEAMGPMLRLRQGSGFFPDREFEIFLPDAGGGLAKMSNQTVLVGPEDRIGFKPHVTKRWMEPGRGLPESSLVQKCAMRLEFGALNGDRLPARIYLCLADRQKSFVRGKFVINLRSMGPPTMPQLQLPRGITPQTAPSFPRRTTPPPPPNFPRPTQPAG